MEANKVADMIVTSIKKSNLNFFIQESPFSLIIHLRKSFIKNKAGYTVLPPVSVLQNSNEVNEALEKEKSKVTKLEHENTALHDSIEQLQVDLQEARDALYEKDIQLENEKKSNSMTVLETNNNFE